MKKFILTFIAIICSCIISSLFGQLKVKDSGGIMVGNANVSIVEGLNNYVNDPQNYSQMQIFGSNGNYRGGGRIIFGDLTSTRYLNVVVGEYTNEDTDQLWLHGKRGVYLTRGNLGTDIIGFYDMNMGNCFQFNCDVKSTGIFVASDSSFKEKITPIKNTLFNLKKLNAVSYKLKQKKENYDLELRNSGNETLGEKEIEYKKDLLKLKESIDAQPKRFGLIAQEVQKVYPELVTKDDSTGYLYVDYMGLIPLTIEALGELDNTISQKDAVIQELEERVRSLEEKLSELILKDASSVEYSAISSVSKVFQNTPNPFKETTTIQYSLSESVKSAYLYVYDLQGTQLKSIIITERGNASVIIKGYELPAGMYIYTLVADQKEVGTYKMILTK